MNKTRFWYFGCFLLILFVFSYAQFQDNNQILQFIKKTKAFIHSVTDKHHCIKENFSFRTVVVGDTAKFCVKGCEEFNKFQWYKDGDSLKGDTKPYLIIPDVQVSDEGKYWCGISSLRGIPECGRKIDTIDLVVSPYKGFDPSSLSNIHLWFREDKGLIIYNAFGVPITPCNKDDYFCIDTTDQDFDKDNHQCQDPHEFIRNFTSRIEENCRRNHSVEMKYSRQTLIGNVENSINGYLQDAVYCLTNDTYWKFKGCFHHQDIDVIPKDFTFFDVFNTYGANCDIFQNVFFRVYTCDSICYIRYENGAKDTLGLIKGLALLTITKSDSELMVQLNGNTIRTINISECYSYFPSLRTMSFTSSFSIGCVPMHFGLWEGTINEFVLYSRALTTAEYDQLRTYLISKYSNHLNDIWHSEWAYAPAFHPSIQKYTAVLPSQVDTVIVDVVKSSPDLPVKIAGKNPPDTIAHLNTLDSVPIEVETSMGTIYYQLNFVKSTNYVIYVNQSAIGAKTGTSWYNAYTDIQSALDDAGKSGKEIWVAEGTYLPSKRTNTVNSRLATFIIKPGIKIIGGFKGSETQPTPVGSPYNTIFNGDILGNDTSILDWPPPADSMYLLADNAYRVLTVNGFRNSISIFLSRLYISGGNASGDINYNYGGGASVNCCPTIEFCGFYRNMSISDGAGIYCKSIPLIDHTLFEGNISLVGRGAGFFLDSKGNITIDGCIFYNNRAEGDTVSFGGGLFINNAQGNVVNSIFANNYASSSGGAVYGANCGLTLTNCTITNNDASLYSGGVHITLTDTPLTIINSILWNNTKGSRINEGFPYMCDVNANKLSITYTSSTYAIQGNGNIVGNPLFVNIDNPKGVDAHFGTLDDGLMLANGSKCIRAGSITDIPSEDILGFNRSTQEPSDLGAYYYQAVNSNVLGIYDDNGVYVPTVSFTVIDGLKSELTIVKSLQKKYHRLIQIELPKNIYTNLKYSVVVQVITLTNNNIAIGNPVNVTLYRVGFSQLFRSHYWMYGALVGKPILFTNNSAMAGEHRYAYVIEGADRCKVKVTLDKGQFIN